MNLGVQYYRAPFPESRYWEDDMRRIRDAGLNTVQLWVLWGWVEAKPGKFVFDDYDRLVELAGKHGLKVVLSTIAEIQPLWIHREVPGSEMVTNMGNKVISSSRGECHFGMTPGGCTDHPGVWSRMRAFLEAVGSRYASLPNLAGWDSWNELRWNINSDGEVCYCPHTVQAFRKWLDQRYGGLDGLNAAWKRRYGQWDEVMPGKMPVRPFTEWMAWSHFLTWKACEHGKARYAVLKGIDSKHPVTLHGGAPSPNCAGGIGAYGGVTPLAFGNDWHFADVLDGIGCSNFPKWFNIDDTDFGMNIEFIRSAARGKHLWLSELQGGRAAATAGVQESVDALSQQRWLWNGLACGADTILFWCWRDEVFGCESAGFGLTGRDGLAGERLEAMRVTGKVVRDHGALLDQYRPVPGTVGVLFSPQTYYGCGAQNGGAEKAKEALLGVARAFVRRSIPYTVIEDEHLEGLQGLRFVYLPAATTLSEKAKAALLAYARDGGVLVVESECGAFTDAGLYVEPPERFLAQTTGLCEVGRRRLAGDSIEVELDGRKTTMKVLQWMTPMVGGKDIHVHAANTEGVLLATAPLGKGKVIYCASYPAEAYRRAYNPGFEDYIEWIAKAAGWQADIEVLSPAPDGNTFLYVKHGSAAGRRVVFVFFHAEHKAARLRFCAGFFKTRKLVDLITNDKHTLAGDPAGVAELALPSPAWRFAVLVEDQA